MYETLKRLYKQGKLDEKGLTNAVANGWLTAEQEQEIKEENANG